MSPKEIPYGIGLNGRIKRPIQAQRGNDLHKNCGAALAQRRMFAFHFHIDIFLCTHILYHLNVHFFNNCAIAALRRKLCAARIFRNCAIFIFRENTCANAALRRKLCAARIFRNCAIFIFRKITCANAAQRRELGAAHFFRSIPHF